MRPELEQARDARRILEKLHRKLLRPSLEVFHHGAAELGVAAECLQRLELTLAPGHRPGPGRQALHWEMTHVRRELEIVQELVAGAGKFYEGWARLMPAAEPAGVSYTLDGQAVAPVALPPPGVLLHG